MLTHPSLRKFFQMGPQVYRPLVRSDAKMLHIDMFEIEKELGEGKGCHVYLAKHKRDQFKCGVKIVNKTSFNEDGGVTEDRIHQEIRTLEDLHHPLILKMAGCWEDDDKIYIIRGLVEKGDLYELLRGQGHPFLEPEAAGYISQTAKALEYLHRNNIMHRDIKPEHILVDIQGGIRLSGFYWSERPPSNEVCGTLDYLPPEMLHPASERPPYDTKVDMWNLGVMMFELLVGFPPFEGQPMETQRRISSGSYEIPDQLSSEAKDLIAKASKCFSSHLKGLERSWAYKQKLLVIEPENRLSAEEVLQHPWIVKGGECGKFGLFNHRGPLALGAKRGDCPAHEITKC